MPEELTTPKKRKNFPPTQIKDSGGNNLDFHIRESEIAEVDISAGYTAKGNALVSGFFICPLVAGTIEVRLINQIDSNRSLPIPIERVNVMVGQWMEEKVVEIVAGGTSVNRALIGWVE